MVRGFTTGGSAQLARLIDQAGEHIIPDLKQYYGLEIRDLFREDNPLSPRWVLLHINNLPVGSATIASIRGGDQFRGWDESRYMLAALIDSVRALKYVTVLAHIDPKKSKPKPPEPFPTPDPRAKRKKELTPGSFGFIAATLLSKSKSRKQGGG